MPSTTGYSVLLSQHVLAAGSDLGHAPCGRDAWTTSPQRHGAPLAESFAHGAAGYACTQAAVERRRAGLCRALHNVMCLAVH